MLIRENREVRVMIVFHIHLNFFLKNSSVMQILNNHFENKNKVSSLYFEIYSFCLLK